VSNLTHFIVNIDTLWWHCRKSEIFSFFPNTSVPYDC